MKCKRIIYSWLKNDTVKDFIDCVDDTEYIVEVERPLKRIYHKDTHKVEWKHLGVMVVMFERNKLPDSLALYGGLIHVRVKNYIPEIRQCYNCFGYGHFKKFCRTRKKCLLCGLDFHGQCTATIKRINCGNSHKAIDKSCPIYA